MKAWQKAIGNALIVALLSFFTQLAVQPQFPPSWQMVYSSALMFAITFLTLCKNLFGEKEGQNTDGTRKTLVKGQKTLRKFKEKVMSFCRDDCKEQKGWGGLMFTLWL